MRDISVRFTDDCNLSCPWCILQNTPRNMVHLWSPAVKREFFQLLKSSFPDKLSIVGGEPLLFPNEIYDIANYLNNNNMRTRITVFSNGTLLTPSIVKKFNDFNIEVRASFSYSGYKTLPKDKNTLFKCLTNRALTNVVDITKPFINDIILLHNEYDCRITISFDYNNLKVLKYESCFINIKHELSCVAGEDWWDFNLIMSHLCDCGTNSLSFFPDGVIRPSPPHSGNSISYCCGELDKVLGKKLHNRYAVMINNAKGVQNGRRVFTYC